METASGLSNLLERVFLSCGIIAPSLLMLTDWIAGKTLPGYSFSAQSISELSAFGSPTRSFVVLLTLLSNLLLIGFGSSIWRTADHETLPRIVAALVIGHAVTGLVATVFFPTNFGERPNFASTGVLLMFLSVVFFVLAMVFGAVAFSGMIRILSIAVPSTYIILAISRFATASTSPQGNAISLIGAQERTMAYSYLLWVLALAIHLIILFNKGDSPVATITG